jgi:1-hydroxy-2-isopentenylcarotenoid 3,4-desaturase
MKKPSVIIVGAGIGGLSEACLLAKQGYKVTVFEKNSSLGGRARVWKKDGFVFDMGPSWYLMPEVFEKFFSEFGKKTTDFYELKKLDPAYRIYYEGEGKLDVPADKKALFELFEKNETGGKKSLEEYLENSKYKYDIAMDKFLYKNYDHLTDFFKLELIKEVIPMQLFSSIDSFVSKKFKNHKLKKILEYSMVFLGGSPKNTPALYSLMTHVDLNIGVWYPLGGLYKVVESLDKLCKNNKVKILKNSEVKKILVENNKAIGVVSNGKKYYSDLIVVNSDYKDAQNRLLKDTKEFVSERKWRKKVIGPSGFILYLGVNKKMKSIKHHNLFLSKNWDEHFDTIFENKQWPDNPCYYVSCPSKTDKKSAPKGCENIFFFVPIASGLKDTKKVRNKMFNLIISDFEKKTGEELKKSIKFKRIYSVNDFKRDYNSYQGSALGLAHTLFQTAIFREKNRSKKIESLYFTGSYTHPGVGVPMVIISALNLRDRILNERR